MDDIQFLQLLDRFGLSWEGYRKVRKGVKKRISRHMQHLGCSTISAYMSQLDKNHEAMSECERLMTVSISRFFRDVKFWETLEEKILPELLEEKSKVFKVWSAGCACGEEIYTFKIVWERLIKTKSLPMDLKIMATDLNPNYIEKAKTGAFHKSSLKEVTEEIRQSFFDTNNQKTLFTVKPFLKKNITWKQQHLFSEPPESEFHLIFLRNNLLTYYRECLKIPAFQGIIDSLAPGGIIVIGSHEHLPFNTPDLIPHGSFPFVFIKTTSRKMK